MIIFTHLSKTFWRISSFLSILALLAACGAPSGAAGPQPAAGLTQYSTPLAEIVEEKSNSSSPKPVVETIAPPSPAPSATPIPLPPSGDWAITASSPAYIQQLYQLKPAPIGRIFDLAWSPDGRFLAASGSSGLVLLDGESLEILRELETSAQFSSLTFSADGRRMAGSSFSMTVQVWDLTDGKTLQVFPQAGAAASISPDGRTLAAVEDILEYDAAGQPGPVKTMLKIFDVETGKLSKTATVSSPFPKWNEVLPETLGIFFSADGKSLQTVNLFGDVRLWNAVNGQPLSAAVNPYTRERLSNGTCQVDGTSGKSFAVECFISYMDPPCIEETPGCDPVAASRYEIGIWDANRINRFRNLVLKDPPSLVLNLVLDPENKEVGLLTADGLDFWGASNSQSPARSHGVEQVAAWSEHLQSCSSCLPPLLAVKPGNGASILAVAYPGYILLWDARVGAIIRSFEHSIGELTAAALDSSGQKVLLAAGFSDGALTVLDPLKGDEIENFGKVHNAAVSHVSFGVDENILISTGADETIKWQQSAKPHPLQTAVFSPYSAFAVNQSAGILVASQVSQNQNKYVTDKKLLLQDIQTGEVRSTLEDWSSQVKISQDGNSLVTGGSNKINLWDLQNATLVRAFPAQSDTSIIQSIAVNPDGSLLAGGQFGLFYAQNANSKEALAQAKIDTFTTTLEFNPSGCLLAAGDLSGRLYLLDIKTGNIISHWQAHAGRINDLAFSRDGRVLLSVGADGAARLWGQAGALALPVGNRPPLSCRFSSPPVTSTPLTPTAAPVTSTPTATATRVTFYRSLSLTDPVMTGGDILQMQQRLFELGYVQVGTPDGVFGAKTDQAVRSFQERNGLVVDGVVGPLTWERLFNSSAVRSS